MRGLLRLFDYTKMIVLLSLTAGLYASLMIPFKGFVIIPGYTEIRPGSVIPVVCSLFFGPAAAWGAAFGNLIGDFVGMLGPGSLFGMAGNFIYGYIPYRVWLQAGPNAPVRLAGVRDVVRYFVAATAASMACGVSIAWGLDLIGAVPFAFLANVITINNVVVTLILGPILIKLLAPRVQAWGLLYQRIMGGTVRGSPAALHIAGILLIYAGGIMALAVANFAHFGDPHLIDYSISGTIFSHTLHLRAGTTPGMALILLGCLLI